MAPLDGTGLAPVSDAAPAGENLELDPEFGALERAAQGKPEVQYGSTIEAAVPPDWKEAATLAEALLARTHDLRVLVHLATARLHLSGIAGFADVVHMIRQELEQHWPEVHPQLDPEDDLDPMQRANALLVLQDPARVLRPLRDLPLASTPRTGPVSWRDLAILNGGVEPEAGREKITEAGAMAAFAGTDRERLGRLRDAVSGLLADLPAISAAFDAHAKPGAGPDYKDLLKLLGEIGRELKRFEPPPTAAEPDPEPDAADVAADAGAGPVAERPAARLAASIQQITSLSRREDALHALDLAADYYRTHEPSSPLPLLIERAKRLAGMQFMDILRDLAPDGVSQAERIAGSTTE